MKRPALDSESIRQLGIHIRRDVVLAPFTSIKVGGPADYFATVTTVTQLLKLVRWARRRELPYFVLGGGSNVLISDSGIRGLVIHNRCRQLRVDEAPYCTAGRDDRPYLVAESGAAMAGAARFSIREGLTGLEWAVSVPGTVGGAVVGNAGAHGGEIKDSLESALILDEEDNVEEYHCSDFGFAYRSSTLKRGQPLRAGFQPVVLSVNFRLVFGPLTSIRAQAESYLNHRRRTQPVEPSLGSTFMNPAGDYAGRLIEEAGLKGASFGGVRFSEVHANFIVNAQGVGGAQASDVVALIDRAREEVLRRFCVDLVPEVQLVGDWAQDKVIQG